MYLFTKIKKVKYIKKLKELFILFNKKIPKYIYPIVILILTIFPIYLILKAPLFSDDIRMVGIKGYMLLHQMTAFDHIIQSQSLFLFTHQRFFPLHLLVFDSFFILFYKVTIIKIIQFILVFFNIFIFTYFLSLISNIKLKKIYYILPIIPILYHFRADAHDPFLTFPISMTLFFSLTLLSFIFFYKYLQNKKKKLLILSLIFHLFCLCYYEIAYLYSPAFFILAMIKDNGWKKSLKYSIPHILLSATVISGIFIFRALNSFETPYTGITPHLDIIKIIETFYIQIAGAFPYWNLSILKNQSFNIIDISYFILIFFLSFKMISYAQKYTFNKKKIILFIIFGIYMMSICALPIALSEKYQIEGRAYIPVYLQYHWLFIVLFTIPWLCNFFKKKSLLYFCP